MTKTERDELDSKVMTAIRGGTCRFSDICVAMPAVFGRDIDRAIQRLRKTGRIQYEAATGWKEVTS